MERTFHHNRTSSLMHGYKPAQYWLISVSSEAVMGGADAVVDTLIDLEKKDVFDAVAVGAG